MTIKIKRVSPKIGAEISGVNLSSKLNKSQILIIRKALLDYGVLFFRDQVLSPGQQMEFGTYFAELLKYPFLEGLKEYPFVVPVLKRPNETINFGGIWHSDTAYLPEPPMATILYAKELPPFGGDTLFASMYAAFDTLSDGMKKLLIKLRAVNSADNQGVLETRANRLRDSGRNISSVGMDSIHPVVRTHPETGRKSLYVNRAHTVCFEGMTNKESAPILNYLYKHQIREEFICRFRWTEGSIAFWDNRCTQHYPVNDYQGFKRLLYRVTLKGCKPV